MAPMNYKPYFDLYVKSAFGANAHRSRAYSDPELFSKQSHLLYTLKQVRSSLLAF